MRKIALDLGVGKITYAEAKDQQIIARGTVSGLAGLAKILGPNTPPAEVVFEACREAWVVHDQLQEWGHLPRMLDTTRDRQLGVGQHKRKTDRIDTDVMALALDAGRIPLAHVLSPHRRQLRFQLSVHRALVETRAQYVTTIRGLARARGHRLPSCHIRTFLAHLRKAALDEETRALIAPLQATLEALEPQLLLADQKLEHLSALEPVIQLLATAPGVGPIVAASFVSTVDEAKRFRNSHQVQAYLGLVPSENSSGSRRRLGAITKQGNRYARAMLTQAAQCILRSRTATDPLKQWGEAIAARRGKRIAVVAVARRLAGVLWSMWRHGTAYNGAKVSAATAQGLRHHARALSAQADDFQRAATQQRRRPKTPSLPARMEVNPG